MHARFHSSTRAADLALNLRTRVAFPPGIFCCSPELYRTSSCSCAHCYAARKSSIAAAHDIRALLRYSQELYRSCTWYPRTASCMLKQYKYTRKSTKICVKDLQIDMLFAAANTWFSLFARICEYANIRRIVRILLVQFGKCPLKVLYTDFITFSGIFCIALDFQEWIQAQAKLPKRPKKGLSFFESSHYSSFSLIS